MQIQIVRGVGIRGTLYKPGDVVDVSKRDAEQLIAGGKAIAAVADAEPAAPPAPQKRRRQTTTARRGRKETTTQED